MGQVRLNVRVNSEDKIRFDEFCTQAGLNTSTCINMFIKAVLREQRLPFEVKVDPFFTKLNLDELKLRIEDMKAGRNISEHDLIEVN